MPKPALNVPPVIDTAATRQATDRSKNWISLFILTVFTLMTFVNSWPDALVFDDRIHLGPQAEHRLEHLGDAFGRDLWNQGTGLYRPLLMIDFELQNRLFGDWRQGYHLVNIFLHLVTTLALFGFLSHFIRVTRPAFENYPFYALLAALVFAVHPTHTEVVNSVFNKSSMYVSLAAITGLWWLLSNLEKRPAGAWIGFGLIYSVAIFFKETALVLPGIGVAMIVMCTGGSLKDRILRCLPAAWLLLPIAVFFWARAAAQVSAGIDPASGPSELTTVLDETQFVFNRSAATGFAQFGQGLKILLWPYPPRLYYTDLGQPQILSYISIQIVLGVWAVYLWMKGRSVLAFSLVFYYLALLPSIRLISLDDTWPHIAERYLYFPSVGLTIALAFGLQAAATRLQRKHLAIIMLPVILVLAAISWDRNADWNSASQLFETEYQLGSRESTALRVLLAAHYNHGRYERVAEICEDNRSRFQESYKLVEVCVMNYLKLGRSDDAIAALKLHAGDGERWIEARLSLAAIYLAGKQNQQVVEQYAAIIDGVEDPAIQFRYKGEMLMMVFPDDRDQLVLARSLLRQALALDPDLISAEKRIEQIDRRLAEIDARAATPDAGRE